MRRRSVCRCRHGAFFRSRRCSQRFALRQGPSHGKRDGEFRPGPALQSLAATTATGGANSVSQRLTGDFGRRRARLGQHASGAQRQPSTPGETPWIRTKTTETIDQDRRRLLGTAAMGIAAAGAASLLPSHLAAAPAGRCRSVPSASTFRTRRWPIFAGASPRRDGPSRRRSTTRSQGVQLATMQAARALLADRLRLAQGRGATERPAAVHHRDRRAGHSFHPCPLEA